MFFRKTVSKLGRLHPDEEHLYRYRTYPNGNVDNVPPTKCAMRMHLFLVKDRNPTSWVYVHIKTVPYLFHGNDTLLPLLPTFRCCSRTYFLLLFADSEVEFGTDGNKLYLSCSLECGHHSPRILKLDLQQLHRRSDDDLKCK